MASAAPRLIVDVVLPTPPFWLTTATTLPTGRSSGGACGCTACGASTNGSSASTSSGSGTTSNTTSTSEAGACRDGVVPPWAEAVRLAGATGPGAGGGGEV